ncbi:nucleocapsid protein [hymenopteran rhabdo-related virus 109]|uniref:Nucleoprotein n=1 Tax=hymenopteran rhabdo-related virus 109 TaxID=2847803 RepID=A0A7D7F7U7_9RHAB|nr:nucleocapsid protein [hymenopteran rhabdo-related virus 109]QMP82140.1 nucleocapsid protein [hymenopteran rhabdo-related virus 109]
MLKTLDESVLEFDKLAEQSQSHLPKATAPSLSGWSDDLLRQLTEKVSFPMYCMNRAYRRRIISRFFDFYFSGNVRSGDSLVATVFDAAAIAEFDNKSIWNPSYFGEVAFYPPNSSLDESLTVRDSGVLPTVQILNPNWSVSAQSDYQSLMACYTNESATLFRNSISGILETIKSTDAASENEKALVRLTSFLALTFCRFATKDKLQMGNTFNKTQYRVNLTTVAFWPTEKAFAPPCKLSLEQAELSLKKGLAPVSRMFMLLADEFVRSRGNDYERQATPGFISASVLTHTARNGLGLITLIEQASEITGYTWKDMLKLTMFDKTEASWREITTFFHTHLNINHSQSSFNWARIINHGYLRGLSPRENPFLACIMAAVVEKKQGEGIWDAEWAKMFAKDMDDAKALGQALYAQSRPKLEDLTGTRYSKELIEKAKKLRDQAQESHGIARLLSDAKW